MRSARMAWYHSWDTVWLRQYRQVVVPAMQVQGIWLCQAAAPPGKPGFGGRGTGLLMPSEQLSTLVPMRAWSARSPQSATGIAAAPAGFAGGKVCGDYSTWALWTSWRCSRDTCVGPWLSHGYKPGPAGMGRGGWCSSGSGRGGCGHGCVYIEISNKYAHSVDEGQQENRTKDCDADFEGLSPLCCGILKGTKRRAGTGNQSTNLDRKSCNEFAQVILALTS